MFSIFKRKSTKPDINSEQDGAIAPEIITKDTVPEATPTPKSITTATEVPIVATSATETKSKSGFFGKLWQTMSRTRERLGSGLKILLTGKRTLDADTRDALETLLLTADIGLDTTDALLEQLSRVKLKEGEDLLAALAQLLIAMLNEAQQKPETMPENTPRVILMVGVNGVGKTTSIAKLAHHFLAQNKKLLLAAGDTFRAAAVEQIKTWGERHHVPVISQGQGSDAASVLYDALQAAQARKVDVMIGDTAGRLHTQGHLMDELKKIRRVMNKLDTTAPHEIWLVIDATTGQNALNQAKEFNAAIGLTGIILTKLDGTAKGGIVLSLSQQLGIPIRYIGIGEQAEDLRPFEVEGFVHALLGIEGK
jgi:fused signal recognition particle receptor